MKRSVREIRRESLCSVSIGVLTPVLESVGVAEEEYLVESVLGLFFVGLSLGLSEKRDVCEGYQGVLYSYSFR